MVMHNGVVKREGMIAEEQDPLIRSLAEARDRCCEEMGLAPMEDIRDISKASGCHRCPCRVECDRLFADAPGNVVHNLSLTEYRKLSQKFYLLQQKRNRMLERRGITLPSHEPA